MALAPNEKVRAGLVPGSPDRDQGTYSLCPIRGVAERQFYLERPEQFGWTKNVLIHQIENKPSRRRC